MNTIFVEFSGNGPELLQNSFVKSAKKTENLYRKLVKQDNGILKRGQSYLQNKQKMILPFLDTNDSGFEAERNL